MAKRISAIFPAIAVLWLSGQAAAQSTVPPEDAESPWDQTVIVLDKSKLQAAQDYQDFIERLENLAYDYQTYYSDLSNVHAKKYQAELQRLIFWINEGRYCSDIEKLSNDLESLVEELDIERSDVRSLPDGRNLLKLNRALRRDLELALEELNDDISQRLLQEEATKRLIQAYLVQERKKITEARKIIEKTVLEHGKLLEEIRESLDALAEAQESLTDEQLLDLEELEELREELEELELDDLEGLYILVEPGEPVPPVPPVEPVEPVAPVAPRVIMRDKGRYSDYGPGMFGVARQFQDSLKISGSTVPIFVRSETGNVQISGWDRNVMAVRFDVEVVAESERSAKSYTEDVELNLFANENGVYVKSHFPSLSDPKRKILKSVMDVKVPRGNNVICENSFGEIRALDLNNGLKINSSYCEVIITDVGGVIEAANKMGTIRVEDSPGKINLKNSMGPIIVTDCRADLDIENSWAPVQIEGCQGILVIRNTGQVEVSDHRGKVDIDNSNGEVEVSDLAGELSVKNAFRPLIISDISGPVTIQNLNANIDASDINGALKAFNRFGMITGKYISGPLDVTNESGRVMVVLDQSLAGPSQIIAENSQVNLVLSEQANVLLAASTDLGLIQADGKHTVRTDQRVTSTEISYGQAKNKLTVTGKNSTIVITDKD